MATKAKTPAQKRFLEVTKEAKAMFKTGKYKKYTDAVKAAWKKK